MNRQQPLGMVVTANEVRTGKPSPRRARNIILLLAGSVALMMTGFGVIMPVFARRLAEFGSGVEALGIMTMSFALAQFVAAPIMGNMADRVGRRPMILLALAAFALANIGYLFAPNTAVFIAIRTAAGVFTAGLFPAAMGIVADIVVEQERGRWIGIVMGGYGACFVFGPVLGGLLYDGFGFAAPFIASAVLAVLALVAATLFVPETRTATIRRRIGLRQRRTQAISKEPTRSIWATLPRPLAVFGTLLLIDFMGAFTFAYIEPQMVFYMYDTLAWTTAQFGLVVGAYGLSMMLGQTILGQTSDRYGRKPIILIGILLNTTLFFGMAAVSTYGMMMLVAVVAGLGSALVAPAASAFYVDITEEKYRARILGIKESSLALGGVLGPLLVAVTAGFLTPKQIFLSAGIFMLVGLVFAFLFLHEPQHQQEKINDDVTTAVNNQRAFAAQASLRGLVLSAQASRQKHSY